jgi:hypothetical protein
METTGIADREEGTAEGESRLQAPVATTVVERGRQDSQAARQGQYADRRDQREAATSRDRHPQQGAARRHFAEARQSIAV